MANETGHARNIQLFQELISAVAGYGIAYKPTNPLIEVAALQAKLEAANNAMDDLSAKRAAESIADTARENLFEPLGKLSTRSINYYSSTGAPENRIADAKVFHRKLHGKRATALPVSVPANAGTAAPPVTPATVGTVATEPAVTHSVSQQSYMQKVEHLDGLIDLFEGDALYAPNEADLTTAQLVNYSDRLKAANAASINAATDIANALAARDSVLYDLGTGLVTVAVLVKKYVKALFGATSPQYNQISGLKFRYYER